MKISDPLTIKLGMLLVIITTAVMALFIGVRFSMNWYEFHEEIDAKFERVAARISATVNPTIWDIYQKSLDRNYTQEVANAILDAELKDPDLVAIKVFGNFGHLFMGKIKQSNGLIVHIDKAKHSEFLQNVDRQQLYPIRIDEMTIGNVEVFFTEAPLRSKLLRSVLFEIAQTILIGLIVIFFLFYALRISLVKPMIALQTARHSVDSMSDGVVVLSPKAEVVEVNNAFTEQTGFQSEEVLEKLLGIFAKGANVADPIQELWSQIRIRGYWSGEIEATHKNGSKYPAGVSITTVLDDNGSVANYVLVLRDNTKEHKLQHSQRMETVGALAGGIAHDINNVLTPIMGWAEVLSEDLDQNQASLHGAKQILKGAERAKGMIDQLMNFSRMSKAYEPREIRLKPLIVDSVSFIQATFPASINIQVDLCDEELMVIGDPGKIEQVLFNIFMNSMHAMEDNGGTLTIAAEIVNTEIDVTQMGVLVGEGDKIHISISDNGHGIPDSVLGNIFEPYFTTKGSGKGNGFGLSTSLGIISKMDGDLTVSSTVDVGTTFHIWLPAAKSIKGAEELGFVSDGQLDELGNGLPSLKILADKTVMMVDDEIDNLKLGEKMLSRFGCHVSSFHDSRKALTAFEGAPEKIDLIITDQSMPHLQGHEFAAKIRKVKPDIPIIVVTGHDLFETEKNYAVLDHICFIRKPFSIKEMTEAVLRSIQLEEKGAEL